MNRSSRIACALLLTITAVTPRVSLGQGTGLTKEQYDGLDERVRTFCEYLFALKREGKPLPMAALRLPGAGDGWVYEGGEVIALTAKCDSLMPLMLQLAKPVR